MKPASLFALILFLPLALAPLPAAPARGGLAITDSSVAVEFPAELRFRLSATSDVNITDVRLYYTVERASYAQVTSEVYLEFVPGTETAVQWTWDMRKTGGLPAGAVVGYWWRVTDADGNTVQTTPARVRFDDNRYSWQSLAEGLVTIYWYRGGQSFAREIMLATQQALARLTKDTGAYLKKPVRIYVYASSRDLREAMIFPQEWTGGVAFTRYGVIAIGIASNRLDWGKRAIAHELTHLVVHQMTFNPYAELPVWLDEGLAMYNEGELEAGFVNYLENALDQDSLISVRSLSSPFPAYVEESYLSYAQSYSLVEFLTHQYGQAKMLGLLNAFSQGISYDGAFEKVYGFDMAELDTLWQGYVKKQHQKAKVSTGVSPARCGTPTELMGGLLTGLSRTGGWGW